MKKIVKNHCCIPPKVENKARWNGYDSYDQIKGDKGYVFKGNSLDTFTKKPWKANKKPWYFLTKEESITINNRHRPVKRTHDDLIIDYLNHKLNKWKKTHPDVDESDLFYKEQHPEWVQKYEEAHDTIVAQLSKKYIKKYTDTLSSYILKSRNKYSSILPEIKSAA